MGERRWSEGRGQRAEGRIACQEASGPGISLSALCPLSRPGDDWEPGRRFDREEAVVLGEAFGLGDRADFDLLAAPADGEIGEPVVLGLAAAGADGDVPVGG